MKSFFCFCLFVTLCTHTLTAQSGPIEYTDQFFVAATKTGSCFVFVYSDNFTFVNVVNNRVSNPVKIVYNMEGLEDVFITGDRFFTRRRETINYYDLSKLTDPANNGRRIDDVRGALLDQIRDISDFSLNGNTIYLSKNGDKNVYMFSPGSNKETLIRGITINPGRFLNFVQNFSLSEERLDEYEHEKNAVNQIVEKIERVGGAGDRGPLEAAISRIRQNDRTANTINRTARDYFDEKYKDVDINRINSFLELAIIAGKTDDAVRIVRRIQMQQTSGITPAMITQFFGADKKIQDTENELIRVFGRNFSQKKTELGRLAALARNNDYSWESFHTDLVPLIGDTSYRDEQKYTDYIFIMDWFSEMKNNDKISDMTKRELEGINVPFFRKRQREIINTSNQSYTSLSTTIETTRGEKSRSINSIIASVSSSYRNDFFSKIVQNPPIGNYDPQYIDYCIITESNRIIHGFSINESLNSSEFMSIKNDKDEVPRFTRPSGYPRVSRTDNGLFVLDSRTIISGYDISRPNILKTTIKPLRIDEGVFYILQGDDSQYIVTNSGRLLQLEIVNGEVKGNSVPNFIITGKDTVLVTGEELYVFQNGAVRNKTGRTVNRFDVKECNGKQKHSVSVTNGQFRITR